MTNLATIYITLLMTFNWRSVPFIIIFLVLLRYWLREKRPKEYADDYGSAPTSIFGKGFWIGDGRIPLKNSFQHCVLIGASGFGKTVGFIIPSALSFAKELCSMIILDPAKEIHQKTSGFNHEKGKRILVLDFSDHKVSVRYNPLSRAKTTTDLNLLAELVMGPQQRNSRDQYWTMSSGRLLVLFWKLQLLLPKQFQNLSNTRHLIVTYMGSPKLVDQLFASIAPPQLFEEYKGTLVSQDAKLTSNIMSTTLASLRPWEDDEVARCTATDTLNLDELRKTPTVLYIWPNLFASHYTVLYEILFSQIFQRYLSQVPANDELDLHILADEMGAFSVKGFSEFLSLARKHRISCQYAIQSRQQIVERYGTNDARNCLANTWSKVIFSNMEPDLAAEVRDRLGRWTFDRNDTNGRGTREVATVSELIHLPEDTAIYLSGSNRPSQIQVKPYFKNWRFQSQSRIPAPTIETDTSDELQLLDIDSFLKSTRA